MPVHSSRNLLQFLEVDKGRSQAKEIAQEKEQNEEESLCLGCVLVRLTANGMKGIDSAQLRIIDDHTAVEIGEKTFWKMKSALQSWTRICTLSIWIQHVLK